MAEQLKIYKLEPYADTLDSLHWQASTYQGPVTIRAATEDRARMIAMQAFGIAVEVTAPGQETAVIRYRPTVPFYFWAAYIYSRHYPCRPFSSNGMCVAAA